MIRRRFASFVAFASIVTAALWGVWVKAEPETVDVRACIPGDAWAYAEFGPGDTKDWKEYFFGGLPDAERQEAEKKLTEIWNDFAKMASEQAGTDVEVLLKEIDRVHFALLDVDLVAVERDYGAGQKYVSERPEAVVVVAIKSKSKGYFLKLLEGDFKKHLQAGPEYKNRKTWVVDTHAEKIESEFKTVSTVHMAAVGDTVLVSNVRTALEGMLDAVDGGPVKGGPLTANADFQKAQKLAGPGAMVLGYVNLKAIMGGLEETLGRDGLEVYQKVDCVLGQSTLRSAVFYSGLDKRYAYSGGSVFLDAKNELWSIIRQEPAKKDLLRVIPGNAAATVIFTITDAGTMWARIQKFVEEKQKLLDPDARPGRMFADELAEFEGQLGVSLDDLFAVIDDEIGWAMLVPEGSMGDPTKVQLGFIELKDVEKAKLVIDNIKDSPIARDLFGAGGEFASTEYEGYTLYNLEGGELPLGYVIIDNFFVLTFDPASQKAVVDAFKASKVLEGDKQFKESMKKLPAQNSKLIYYDAGAVARLIIEAADVDPEAKDKLKGAQGIAFVTVEKAEEASVMAGCELNSEYYASIVKNALPMIEDARNNSVNTQCIAHLRVIGTAASTYVEMHGDSREYPMTLQDLVDKQLIPASYDACPTPGKAKYTWLYPPKGFGTGMDTILAHDSAPHPGGKRGVLYFSGKVETVDEAQFATLIQEQYKALLPDIDAALEETNNKLEDSPKEEMEKLEAKKKFLEAYKKDIEAKSGK